MGDSEAPDLEQLIANAMPALAAFVRAKVGPAIRARESLSDVVQSVCVELLRESDRFEYRGEAAFRAWLFRHAMSKICDKAVFYRRERRESGAKPASRCRTTSVRPG